MDQELSFSVGDKIIVEGRQLTIISIDADRVTFEITQESKLREKFLLAHKREVAHFMSNTGMSV